MNKHSGSISGKHWIQLKGLKLKLLSRDVYMLDGNIKKLARATEIIREEIER